MTIGWDSFFEQVKSGTIARAYLMTGPEAYMKRAAIALLREKLLPPGLEAMNETILDGADAQTIVEAAETLPFMGARRLVLAKGWAVLASKAKVGKDEEARLCDWLNRPNDTCCLVLDQPCTEEKSPKPPASLEKLLTVVTFDRLNDSKLFQWIDQYVRKNAASIERSATEQLAFMAGRDLTKLSGELDKLIAYAHGAPISRRAIEDLVAPSTECTVFQMIDCLFGNKPAQAQALYQTMRRAGETNIGILAMLIRQTRMLTHIKTMRGEGRSLNDITRALALNPYAAKRAESQSRAIDEATLAQFYTVSVDTDYAIKSGRLSDEEALPWLILKMGATK